MSNNHPITPRHISFLFYLHGYMVSQGNGYKIDSTTAINIEEKFCGGEVEGLIPDLVCPGNLIEMDDDWCVFTDDGIAFINEIIALTKPYGDS